MSDSDRGKRSQALDQGLGVFTAIVLCCLIVGVLSFSWGRDSERDGQRAAEYKDYAEQRESAFCADLTGSLFTKCEIEQEQAAREAYQAARDLDAQRDMSLWALAVFIIGFVTAGLTLWALWYVRGTLNATLKAVEDTSEATEAMREANKIARETQQRQLRAYIAITGLRTTRFEAGKVPEFRLEFTNTGQTPAYGVHIIAKQIFYRTENGEPPARFPDRTGAVSTFILPPGTPWPHVDPLLAHLTEGQAADLNEGRIGIMFAGAIVYRDIFRRRRVTAFKAIVDLDKKDGPSHGLRICRRGNYAT